MHTSTAETVGSMMFMVACAIFVPVRLMLIGESGQAPFGLFGLLTLPTLLWIETERWRKRVPEPGTIRPFPERSTVEGTIHPVGATLRSPATGSEFVAWLGWQEEEHMRDEAVARSVPFLVFPTNGGEPAFIRLANGRMRSNRAWDYAAVGESKCRGRQDPWDLFEFLLPALREDAKARGEPIPSDRIEEHHTMWILGEITYQPGELVTLAGRFRRLPDEPAYRGMAPLGRSYAVVNDVVLAKGPAKLHRSLWSPRNRAHFWYFAAGSLMGEATGELVWLFFTHVVLGIA